MDNPHKKFSEIFPKGAIKLPCEVQAVEVNVFISVLLKDISPEIMNRYLLLMRDTCDYRVVLIYSLVSAGVPSEKTG